MVIRVGNVGEMIGRVNGDLEKVGKAAVGAAKEATSRDLPRVVHVVSGLAQGENWRDRMAVDGLRNVDVQVSGQWDRVRVDGMVGTVPRDGNVTVGIRSAPGAHVRLSGLECVSSYITGRRPTLA